jgi:hypothetical protein
MIAIRPLLAIALSPAKLAQYIIDNNVPLHMPAPGETVRA